MPEIKLPEVELNIYSPKNFTEVTIVENYICTAESSPNMVRHVIFDVGGTDLEGRVKVGQSIGFLAPGEDERGRAHKLRLYSVSSPTEGENGQSNLIATTVKRTVEEIDGKLFLGVCSNFLADLKPGDKIKATGPSGKRFLLPENAEDFNYIFFATGTGIAPFRGMVMELLKRGAKGKIVIVFGCPYRTDLLYSDYFFEMEKKHDNFHFIARISREERRPDGSKKYVQTAIEDEKEILAPILEQDNTLIYLCGMKGMETGIYHELAKKGYDSYIITKGVLQEKAPNEWTAEDMLRNIKPSVKTFEEVY